MIMGIDASTSSTGVSIFDEDKLIFHTTIKGSGNDWREKMYSQGDKISKIIKKYKPNKIVMEDVPLKVAGGLKILVVLGAVQGFVYGIASAHDIAIEFVQANQWRSKLNLYDGTQKGKTRAVLKEKAVKLANKLFDLNLIWVSETSKKSQDDEAEAILIAYSTIIDSRFNKKIKERE